MIVAIGSDHAGFSIKQVVIEAVRAAGHEPLDLGPYDRERVDFPDFAEKVGRAIQRFEAQRGIAICGSGVGVCIAANKMRGIYASVCHDTYSAHQGVEHDDMNVLCLGGNIIGPELAKELTAVFLNAEYLNTGNYARRVEKMKKIESTEMNQSGR